MLQDEEPPASQPQPAPDWKAEAWEAEGGDPACWLAHVCVDCGAIATEPGVPCWRCGRHPDEE